MKSRVFNLGLAVFQKFPNSWKVTLTHSPVLTTLRNLSQNLNPKGFQTVKLSYPISGYSMRLDMNSGHRRYALGTYEPHICQLIKENLSQGDVAFDIGANIGYFTLLMANLVGKQGQVFAFEPMPTVYSLLSENIQLNPCSQVKIERVAITDIDGLSQMETETDNDLSFISKLSDKGDVTVPAMRLDSYLSDKELERLDFIKLDVEGAEDLVSRGMLKTLDKFHPTLLIELHDIGKVESEILNTLVDHGYTLKRVELHALVDCDTQIRPGHVLAKYNS